MTAPRQRRRVLTSIPAVCQDWSPGTAGVTLEGHSFATCPRPAKSAPPSDPGCHPERRQQAYQQSHPEPESHHPEPESHHPEPESHHPEPESPHPEPDLHHPEPDLYHPEPDLHHPEPDLHHPEPASHP